MDERFEHTVEAARAAVEQGRAADWVASFLASDGSDNALLGRELRDERTSWYGPIRVEFDVLHRLAGPPDQPTLDRLDEDDLDTVDDMEDSLDEGWNPPPVIATWSDGHLTVEDGNHRIEGLRRAGRSDWWTLVAFENERDREQFLARRADVVTTS